MDYIQKKKEEFEERFSYLESVIPEGDCDYEQLWQFIESKLKEERERMLEEVEKVFDQFRSSNVTYRNGKKRFGLDITTKYIREEVIKILEHSQTNRR